MIEPLRHLDNELFIYLNSHRSALLDPVMILLSSRFFWVPAYAALIIYLVYQYRRSGVLMVLMIILAVGAADMFSSGFFKPFFGRLRPCHDPELAGLINMVNGCGGSFGFVSSHAANTFCLAFFLNIVLPPRYFWFKASVFLWAFGVSYSRIYLAAHFPGDVIVGALLGGVLAWLISKLYFRLERYPFFRRS
ncbi:MAG TPA: phosphatase PAP2 family protein [Adhaeribacter sp.]|nr:phosphatase PAP2 family protein [Adhaeribacter sp.]